MFWLKILKDFLKILREGQTPQQIAWGFALGTIVGLSPALSLQAIIVWLLILLLDINIAAAILSFTFFSIAAFLLDPLFHKFGFWILTQIGFLHGTYTTMYNAPIAPLTRFNNTVVMGSFVSSLILMIPVYFAAKFFIIKYREKIYSKVKKWKIYQAVNQSGIVRVYLKIRDMGGMS